MHHTALRAIACAALCWACSADTHLPAPPALIDASREDVENGSGGAPEPGPEPVVEQQPEPLVTEPPPPEPEAVVEPEPVVFGFRVEAHTDVVQEALDRWVAAACIDVAIDPQGPHEILFTTEGFTSPHRIGQTTGRWEAATIRIRDEGWLDEQLVTVLMHELAHLLAVTNDHIDGSVLSEEDGFAPENQFISAELLGLVCERQRCGCFQPEG